MDDLKGLTVAPCGCRFGTRGDVFVFAPCSLGCDLYEYVIAESARQGHPLATVVED